MIISCPNCNKQFKINSSLIPNKGRDLKCGSCDHVWFYKTDDNKLESISFNKDFIDNKDKSTIFEKKIEKIVEKKKTSHQNKIDHKITDKQTQRKNKKKENTIAKFFSHLIVLIISFVALIVLVDTLKKPLINVFPDMEIILFNLFEILKDIKLFIIDLY